MGNVFARGEIFKWSIEGYSSIEKNVETYWSGNFEAQGYSWRMILYPHHKEHSDEKSFLYLGLCLDVSSLPSNVVLKVDYKLGIYDELHGNHQWRRGNNYFSLDYCHWVLRVLPMERIKSSADGFLVNDCCSLGAQILDVFPVKMRIGASECSSVREKMISCSNSWTINNFSRIQKPIYSKDFEASRLNWHIKLEKRVHYIDVFLELDKSTTLPPNSGVNVGLTLCVVDQVKGNHEKRTGQFQFRSKSLGLGWQNFLHLEDLQNPSNGFLVNDTCIVEASIVVLGSSSHHDF